MTRFIANYIYYDRSEWRNHIASISPDRRHIALEPVSGELAMTRYVPNPLCITPHPEEAIRLFRQAASREAFADAWSSAPPAGDQNPLTVLELNFQNRTATPLIL
ncbi:MAG: hypothetical protein IJ626_04275 [Muribaculaceae bacterium]|nr:hypothetical protein [Muribaculaceae bacterium]